MLDTIALPIEVRHIILILFSFYCLVFLVLSLAMKESLSISRLGERLISWLP